MLRTCICIDSYIYTLLEEILLVILLLQKAGASVNSDIFDKSVFCVTSTLRDKQPLEKHVLVLHVCVCAPRETFVFTSKSHSGDGTFDTDILRRGISIQGETCRLTQLKTYKYIYHISTSGIRVRQRRKRRNGKIDGNRQTASLCLKHLN